MTIHEAISHCYEVSNNKCDACGAEHKQLARWLEDYLQLKYELEYIEKNILSIPSEDERKERCLFIVKRLINLYGGSHND